MNEADKVLKKQKDLLAAKVSIFFIYLLISFIKNFVFKVLKVIAMQRLARSEEAFELSQQVISEKPIDENSLQGMSLYYKEINRCELN